MGAFDEYNAIEASTAWGSPNDQEVWPWWAFVKEKWIPRPANFTIEAQPEYELEQRKQLVKEWMNARQAFRDAYVARTSSFSPTEAQSLRHGLYTKGGHESDDPRYLPSKYPLILSVKSSPSSRAAWARLLFLTRYNSMGTCGEEPAPHYTPSFEMAIEPTTFPTACLPYYCPNFDLLGLDRQGRPYIYRELYQFVDSQGLQEGSKLVIEYASDGRIARSRRLIAYFCKDDENKVCSMGHGWLDIVEEYEWDPESDAIDVYRLGIVDLILRAKVAQGLDMEEDEDEIRSDVATFAPELLE